MRSRVVRFLVLLLLALAGCAGTPTTTPPSSLAPALRSCADALDRWRSAPTATTETAQDVLAVFARCQTVADLQAVVAATDPRAIADVRAWVDDRCRRFRLEVELGQTPLCRDARGAR